MLAFTGVAMVAMLGGVALVIDTGLGSRQRRIAQTAADAGALGGAHEIMRLNASGTVTAAALAEAVRNGFASGEVTVNYPPATGAYAGNVQYVEVLIARNTPTLFAKLFNRSSWDIKARGVAGISTTSFNCIFVLNPVEPAVELNGTINANCGVAVNGGLLGKAGANLNATSIAVGGTIDNKADYTPAASVGAPPLVNPLLKLDTTITNYVAENPSCDFTTTYVVNGTKTLDPGVYCGGISITNASNKAILNPGVYIMKGGGITITNSGVLEGTGVTIINTNGPGNNAALYAPYNFGNGCKANISAPTSGRFEGLLILQDPTAGVSGTAYSNVFACSSDYPLNGTIYLATQEAYFGGSNSDTQINGSLIAATVEVKSGTTLTMNQPVTSNSVVKRISLVE